jgi:hypothetical protein
MTDRDENGKFIQGNQASKGKGRTKGAFSINDELRRLLSKPIKDTDPELVAKLAKENPKYAKEFGKRKTYEVWAKQIIREAMRGDVAHSLQLWQQLEGKPKQQVDVDANIKQRSEMIVIDASGKQLEDDESPLDEDNSKS